MIAKPIQGSGISGVMRYCLSEGREALTGRYKTRSEYDPSRVEIVGGRGIGLDINSPERLDLWRRYAEWSAANQHSKTRQCEQDALHLSLNWEPGQEPTNEEMQRAAESALAALKMENAAAVWIRHNDTRHPHLHIIASRIDPESGRALSTHQSKLRLIAWGLDYERETGHIPEARRELHQIADAVRARDPAAMLAALTERNASVTQRELDTAMAYGGLLDQPDEKRALDRQLRAHPDFVPLEDRRGRFTSTQVLEQEKRVLDNGRALASNTGETTEPSGQLSRRDFLRGAAASFGVWAVNLQKHEQGLTTEQREALWRATRDDGLTIISGEAGTGKSHLIQKIAAAYGDQGRGVTGMSSTNSVVADMRRDGLTANTIDAEMLRLGDKNWNRGDVLIVDEASQLSHRNMDRVLERARASGAKTILVGDDKQLSAIERGGLFTELVREHGAAELKTVMRTKDPDQQRAWRRMHDGGEDAFCQALQTFDRQGQVHWSDHAHEAEHALATRYRQDVEADPTKTRFMHAVENSAVDRLNQMAREQLKALGQLQDGQVLKTRNGPMEFAPGDRIQMTGNGANPSEKARGFVNGYLGTLTKLERKGDDLYVSANVPTRDGRDRELTWQWGDKPGEFNAITHGFAGTTYKSQGRTLDETYSLVSPNQRASASYVMATRHREQGHLFLSRDKFDDLDDVAEKMARPDRKRAASAYPIDREQMQRLRERAAEQVRDADAGARSRARAPEPPEQPQEWRGAARRADALNRRARAAEPSRETPPSTTVPPDADRALRDRDGAPLGGAAHPQGPVERAQQRDAFRGSAEPEPVRTTGDAPGLTVGAPRDESWILRGFRQAAEYSNAQRFREAFGWRAPDITPSAEPSPTPAPEQRRPRFQQIGEELGRAARERFDAARSWWNGPTEPTRTTESRPTPEPRHEPERHAEPTPAPTPHRGSTDAGQRDASPSAAPERRPEPAPQPQQREHTRERDREI